MYFYILLSDSVCLFPWRYPTSSSTSYEHAVWLYQSCHLARNACFLGSRNLFIAIRQPFYILHVHALSQSRVHMGLYLTKEKSLVSHKEYPFIQSTKRIFPAYIHNL